MANRRIISDVEEATDDQIEVFDEVVVNDDLVSARVKGTWSMNWGPSKYNFEDGKRYRIPRELFQYLKSRACIYDTL
jgi:hypothetical protein